MKIDLTIQTEDKTIHIYNEESDFLPVIDIISGNDEAFSYFLVDKEDNEDTEALKIIEAFQGLIENLERKDNNR